MVVRKTTDSFNKKLNTLEKSANNGAIRRQYEKSHSDVLKKIGVFRHFLGNT